MESLVGNIDFKESLKVYIGSNISNASPSLVGKVRHGYVHFETMDFPTVRNEDWKYTNFSGVLKKNFNLSPTPNISDAALAELIYPALEGNILVVVNGFFRADLSSIKEDSSNLEFQPLANYSSEFIEKYVANTISVNDAFTALNTTNAEQTIVLRVPKGKIVSSPIYIYFINTAEETTFVQPRVLVVAEENSQIKLSEIYQKVGSATLFTNAFTDIYLHENAHVEYYKVQPTTPENYHVGTTQVVHLAKSVFAGTTITLGGTIIRNNLNIVLQAPNCDSTLYGLYVANTNEHIDNHTLVDHAMPNCLSNELYKGVLNGKSTGVFNGKIFVREDAQKTNAFQSNKTILLSNDATMNTKPQLEIFADDVKCSHGATIGQLNEEPLFYLRSRGLSEDTAKKMLVAAFAQDIIEHIKLQPLKHFLIDALQQVLGED